ncbi:MAG: hypothetical protein IT461_15285 [Planctomycetes bacterium]|nr:hypothetical protein [Planctomycetota bacterium]
MPTYRMRAKIKRGHIKLAKGRVKVDVKTNLRGEEADVTLTVTPVPKRRKAKGWPKGYFENVIGSLADNPIKRWPQGEYETRKSLDDIST